MIIAADTGGSDLPAVRTPAGAAVPTETDAYLARDGARFPLDRPLWRDPRGPGPDGTPGPLALTPGSGLGADEIETGVRSLWRYAAALRVDPADAVTLGEGWTPLLPLAWGGTRALAKAEYLAPSGSFKDRGSSVMLSYLRAHGVDRVLEDSSGNAGASIAAYAAAAGLRCRILVPASASPAKLVQMRVTGAEVVPVAGSRQDVAEAALAQAETMFYASHNWQPFFLEGTKTLAFELWEQLDFRAPDNVIVPFGYGSNVLGAWIGFDELRRAGRIDRLPRLFAVQAANCAPLHAAFMAGGDALVPTEILPTAAEGIASSRPIRVAESLRALRASGGRTVAVPEAAIGPALGRLARAGHFVEPTSAVAAAALDMLLADGTVEPGQTTVLVLTGSGLKAAEAVGRLLG